jgi:VanZ family protein
LTRPVDISLKQLCRWPLFYHWLPLIVWMGLIFWLSSQPQPFDLPDPWQESLVGISGHILGYAGLSILWWRTLAARPSAPGRRTLALAFFLTVLYAVSDEVHQTFVPGRSGTFGDLLIDAAGAAMSLWLVHRWQSRQ